MESYNRDRSRRWRLTKLKPATIAKRAKEYNDNVAKSHKESEAKRLELLTRYQNMLHQVINWLPPSQDHFNFKKFMIEQLESSIEWDCSHSYEREKELTPEEWYKIQYDQLTWSMNYHLEEHKKDVERTRGRNKWLKELRESLKNV